MKIETSAAKIVSDVAGISHSSAIRVLRESNVEAGVIVRQSKIESGEVAFAFNKAPGSDELIYGVYGENGLANTKVSNSLNGPLQFDPRPKSSNVVHGLTVLIVETYLLPIAPSNQSTSAAPVNYSSWCRTVPSAEQVEYIESHLSADGEIKEWIMKSLSPHSDSDALKFESHITKLLVQAGVGDKEEAFIYFGWMQAFYMAEHDATPRKRAPQPTK